ncbi:MAG TPA: protein kinase [Bryobacteraceae bacterium]|nr:protein kinase [Bryobacteraceae bacterium]
MHLTMGSRLGRYEILGPIGKGGMGEIYRARDPRLNRQVAIKLLPPEMAADEASRERLRHEAMAAAALDHPYICKVFEIGEHDGSIFLVMEYIAGVTLHQRMCAGKIPLNDALRVSGEISEALEEAHARGILHRDLKPANIMLTEHGHVKIMDFGLAKRMGSLPAQDQPTVEMRPQLTEPGTILGTPDYMSPEQVRGLPLDARSDQFSFGVILAEMAGGVHPFRKSSTVETMSSVLRDPPTLGTSKSLAGILQRMMAKDSAQRYPSIGAVRAELGRVDVDDQEVVATARGRWKWPAIAAAVLVVGLGAYLAMHSGGAPHGIRSIAVLPLDNYSGDPKQEYFVEGMTDELTADLATISQLRVISRGSAMQFKGKSRPPMPQIAKALNVDAVVEGSVVREGERVRINAQLIDARADKYLWSKKFERDSRDVLALQDELASAIAREIDVQLTPTEQSRFKTAPVVDPQAYDAYLRGRFFFNRPSDENLKKAIDHFEEAVKLNPAFAPAYSGLSDAYLWAGYNEGVLTAADAKPKAKAAAEKAIELDDNSAEAHASLATFKLFYEFDWAGCEREFRRAFSLNPNYAFAHDQFGLALAFQGRYDESLSEGKRAAALDPLSPQIPIDSMIGLAFSGKHRAALDAAKRAAELDPTYFFAPWAEGWADIQAGNITASIPVLQKSKSMEAPAFVGAWLGYAYGASGDLAHARAELADLRRTSLNGRVLPFNLALVYLGLGERARALDYLEEAYDSSSQWMGWLKNDQVFATLRSEPRYLALLRKLRFI